MTVNDLFIKGNKLFAEKKFLEGLAIYKEIYLRFPKNLRLYEEIKKKENKYKKPIYESYSKYEIEEFLKLGNAGHAHSVIKILTSNYNKNSNDILTISLLGNFYGLNKEIKKAIYFQKLAIHKAPFESAFYLNLSETLRKSNQLDESLSILYLAKILSLKDTTIDYKLAKLNTKLKNFETSNLIYADLIQDKNLNKEIILSYCDNLIKFKKEDQVISFIKKFEDKFLTDGSLQAILGLAFYQKKEIDKAKKFILNSIRLNKYNSNAFTFLGDCYAAEGDLKNAKINYENSLDIHPNNKMALNNLAALSFLNGDFVKAEKIYELSVNNNENNYDAIYYLGQCQLAQCNFVSGWENFGYRWLANQFNSKKLKSSLPKFYLNSDKKNLLVWGEQGIGDQILFLRFLKDLDPFIDNLFINIDNRLHMIIKRLYPKINFMNDNDNKANINVNTQIPLGDLGSMFMKDTSYLLKNKYRYITSDFEIKNNLQNILRINKKIICGISWISKNEDIGNEKSLSLERLKPILCLKNIMFVDLQYNDTTNEKNEFYNTNKIKINKIESIDNFKDLNGLTSLIDCCDLVVTVSNTNAHISGALGKKTFLLLPKGKGRLWYWTSKNKKSLWYPSIDIIEQNVAGSWKSAINELSKKIMEILN